MADLFGSPLGDIAYGEQQLTQAKSLALMGQLAEVPSKIALQTAQAAEIPSKIALQGAQARHEAATAAQLELATIASKRMQDFATNYQQQKLETQARQKLVDTQNNKGLIANAGDLPPKTGQLLSFDPASDMADMIRAAGEAGIDSFTLEPHITKYVGIVQKNAMAAQENATAAERNAQASKINWAQMGGIAMAAGESEANYNALQLSPDWMKIPQVIRSKLTGDFRTDGPVLRALGKATIDADKQADNTRADTKAVADGLKDNATTAASWASASKANAAANLINQQVDIVTKNGGKYNPELEALHDQQAQSKREAEIGARVTKTTTGGWAPLDPKKLEENFDKTPEKTYVLPDTSTARLAKHPQTGKLVWVPLLPPIPDYLAERKTARNKAAKEREKAIEKGMKTVQSVGAE